MISFLDGGRPLSAFIERDIIEEIEARLYEYLRIPSPRPRLGGQPPPTLCGESSLNLERLRVAVSELERSVASIGEIPNGYPKHIHLVMKIISAVIPWYTRNLIRFGQQTTQTARAILEALGQIAVTQEELSALYRSMHAAAPQPQPSSSPRGIPENSFPIRQV
jgi:hypothetical protein